MATYQLIANSSQTALSPALNSTKVKVISNLACFYAVGNTTSIVAYTTGNCAQVPANVFRDIIVGPANLVVDNSTSTVISSINPRITFITTAGAPALVTITEIGSVDFTKVPA
jgi:hypothetical protein